jgi:ABC-2 type transport system permease protein
MNKIQTIIRKEWAEVFKNKMVLFTVIFLPLMFTVLPLGILYGTGAAGMENMASELPQQFTQFCPEGLAAGECFQVYIVSQFLLLFMLAPLIIPVNIAAYSIIGEKTTRSLEPLLATPITTAELLLGKILAAVIPASIATFICFGLFISGAAILTSSSGVMTALLDPMWLMAVFILGPLLAVLSVNVSIMISSRVSDPRVAEQLSAVVVLPLLLLFFGQLAGLFFLSRQLVLVIAAFLVLIDTVIIYFAVHLFQRETILTRWK